MISKYSAVLLLIFGTLAVCAWAQAVPEHFPEANELINREKREPSRNRRETEEEGNARGHRIAQDYHSQQAMEDRQKVYDAQVKFIADQIHEQNVRNQQNQPRIRG